MFAQWPGLLSQHFDDGFRRLGAVGDVFSDGAPLDNQPAYVRSADHAAVRAVGVRRKFLFAMSWL